jgi:hypothetical protein
MEQETYTVQIATSHMGLGGRKLRDLPSMPLEALPVQGGEFR